MKRTSTKRGAAALIALWFAALPTPCVAESAAEWDVWLEQDGEKIPLADEVTLKAKPFAFVFAGDKRLAYAVVASVEKSDLDTLKTETEISKVIRPTNIRAEAGDRSSSELLVHAKGAIGSGDNGCQVWSEDPENQLFSFQSFDVDANGNAVARREIRTLDLYVNYEKEQQVAVETLGAMQIYVLIAGLPPIGRMAYTDPKLFAVRFQ
jgi:hypothetical protein